MHRSAVVLFLAAFAAACKDAAPSREAAYVEVRLDRRAPDRTSVSSSYLVAGEVTGFGEAAADGWDRRSVAIDGVPAVWTVADVATLHLTVESTGADTIVVDIAAIMAGAPLSIEGHFNGTSLGQVEIAGAPARVEFEVPRGAWRGGKNILSLRPSATTLELRDEGVVALGVAVHRVEFAREVVVVGHEDRLTFEPGASTVFMVEGRGALELTGRCTVSGAGTLIVEPVQLERSSGRFVSDGTQSRIDLDVGAEFELASSFEPREPGPLGVKLTWSGAAGSTGALVVERPTARRELALRAGEGPTPLIFISIDTLSARNMGLHGYERDTTPQLAAFAREAVVFDACRSNAPWTVPSYLSQFTGLLPRASRVVHDVHDSQVQPWDRRMLSDSHWSLAELLRATGRTTFAVVDNPWLHDLRGLRRGFDHFDDEPARRGPFDLDGGMRLVFERGLAFLDEHDSSDPFLFLQILDVHGPYISTESFAGRYGSMERRNDDALLPVVGDRTLVARAVPHHIAGALRGEPLVGSDVAGRRVVAAYDEGILELDHEFGRFIDGLRARGIYDRAIIVVSADHGEALLESTFTFVHGFPNEQTVRVPLLVKLPNSRGGGRRVSQDVQLVDLYPTFAELAGVPVGDRELHGLTLVPLLEGSDVVFPSRPTVIMDGSMETRAIVDGHWKLTVYDLSQVTPEALLSLPAARARWKEFEPRVALLDRDSRLAPNRIADFFRFDAPSPLDAHPDAFAVLHHMRAFQDSKPTLRMLHDLQADPFELVDRASEHPDVVERLSRALDRAFDASDRLRPRADVSAQVEGEFDLELLRELGYATDH